MTKNKYKIHINPNELTIRDELHFNVQKNTRMNVFKPKKGKGSFTRKEKHRNKNLDF